MPPPSPPSPAPPKPGSNAGTAIAAAMLMVCAAGFFVLVMFVNPFIAGVLLIPAVLGPLAVIQYLLWGRWLDRMREEYEAQEQDDHS